MLSCENCWADSVVAVNVRAEAELAGGVEGVRQERSCVGVGARGQLQKDGGGGRTCGPSSARC